MFRGTRFVFKKRASNFIPPEARVGIFPIHLDPPTHQHEQIFRLLLGLEATPERTVKIHDSKKKKESTKNNGEEEVRLAVPPRFAYLNSFAKSIREDSQLIPFEHLIIVPNTQYPVSLKRSTHLAALAVLATRGLPNVHVDFTALEHPDESMPIIQDLCNTYTNSAIVHWLHDAYEMQNWKGFADIKVEVPLLLLQTTSYPSSSLPRYRPTVEETPYVLYSRQYHSDKDLENLNHGHTTEEEAKYYEQVRQNLKRVAALRADIQKEVRSSLLDVEKGKNTSDERAPDDDDEAENDNRTEDEVLEKLVSEGNLLDKYKLNSKQRLHLDEVYGKYESSSKYKLDQRKDKPKHTSSTPTTLPSLSGCVKGRWWRTKGGRGDDQVEISRSYYGSGGISWLGISFEEEADMETAALLDSLPMAYQSSKKGTLGRLRQKINHMKAAKKGQEFSSPLPESLTRAEDVRILADGSLEVKVHLPESAEEEREEEGSKAVDKHDVHACTCIPSGSDLPKELFEQLGQVRSDLEDMLMPTHVQSTDTDTDLDGMSETFFNQQDDLIKEKKKDDDEDGDHPEEEPSRSLVRTYHRFAPRTVRQLIEELYPPHLFQYQNTGTSCTDSKFTGGIVPMVEVHPIVRTTGADVRHAMWEREIEPKAIFSDAVLRYIETHGLYKDSRKQFNGSYRTNTGNNNDPTTFGTAAYNTYLTSIGVAAGSNRRAPVLKETATMTFPGVIPRLELHYDKNNLLAREQYEKLKAFQCKDPNQQPDLIVPIGGDGYMMHCIRRNWDRFIPFYGVNAGHVGYLLNDCSTLEELFAFPLKLHTTTMLYCQAEQETETGERVLLSELAFNDAWVERASGQTALIRILVNGEERIRRLRGDGVLVSTAAGSTAYSQALGASPVPVGAPLIQVVGSNVVSPAQWRPAHLDQEDQVEFEVLDINKRPCKCYVDSVNVGNVTRMLVRSSRVAGVTLAFSRSCDLQHKLYQMQFPKTL